MNDPVQVSAQGRFGSMRHVGEVVVTGGASSPRDHPVQALADDPLHTLSSHNVADPQKNRCCVSVSDD